MSNFKFKKRNLLYLAVSIIFLFLFATVIPALRPSVISIVNLPLNLCMCLGREASGIIFYHRNLVQNEKLKKQLELLKYNSNETREVFFENNRLRQLLSFKQRFPYKVIAARVVGHSADNWSSVIIVDRGESSGIRRGLVVVSYIGLVGRVVETTPSISKIMLINNPNFGVSGIVQRSRQEGLVTGTLSNSLIMKYLPADSDVAVSDVIVTSGLTETYPKGLIIGTVVDVGEEFSGLSHYAVIKSAVDLSSLEEVLIIVS